MGWGYRKSFGSKAFRVNVSKSGIGFSTGVKGFRVSTNSRGTFVNIGGGGVYYRQKIGGGYAQGRGVRPSPSTPQPRPSAAQPSVSFQAVATADAGSLVDQRSEQLLSAINEAVSQPGAMRVVLPIAIVSTLLTSFAAAWLPFASGLVWLLALAYIAQADRKARTYSLLFELDPAAEARWREMNAVLSRFASTQAIWRIAANAHTTDWKRNAGAQTLVDRRRATVYQKEPPLISTNVKPWCIDVGDQQLCFMPDRLLVYGQGRYGAVEYDALGIGFSFDQFVESGPVPGDATRVGTTYPYVNKNGTPDRRFSNNREIPIMQYGRTVISSSAGLNIHLQVSSTVAAQALTGFRIPPQGQHRQQAPSGSTGPRPGSRSQLRPQPVPRCYVVLGLRPGCTRDEATAIYRPLVKRYHPDLLSGLSPDLAAIAEERMKEINVAFEELRKLNGW